MRNYDGVYKGNYEGIYYQWNEVPNCDACGCIVMIDDIIKRINFIKISPCRELSLAVTKLQEAQLWLTQVSG